MEPVHRPRQRRYLSPPARQILHQGGRGGGSGGGGGGDLTDAGRVGLVVVLVENVDEAVKPDALEARELGVVVVGVEEGGEEVVRHHGDLREVHGPGVHRPEREARRAVGAVAEAGEDEAVAAGEQEREEHPRRPEGLDPAPHPPPEVERRHGAGVDPENEEEPPAEERAREPLGRVPRPEVRRQRGAQLPGIRRRVVDLHRESVLDVDQPPHETRTTGNDEPRPATAGEDTDEGVAAGEVERGRLAPRAADEGRVAEAGGRGGGEEESAGAGKAVDVGGGGGVR